MASYHVLTGSEDGNNFAIVYHIAIPAGANNRAGIAYRTALINSGAGGKTILPDGDGSGGTISAAEKASIASGAIFEVAEPIDTNPGETAGQLQTRLDARYNALVTLTQQRVQSRLSYFGFTRNVP